MATIVGTDIPTGDEVKWYMGGALATQVKEALTEVAGVITLTKKADFGSVFVVDSNDDPTTQMLELQADGTTPATEASGTNKVKTSAAGTASVTAYYVDIETTALVQVMACKEVSTSVDIDTKEVSVHGRTQKLLKAGAASRTATLEEVDYNDNLIAAIMGDQHSASPAASQKKWTDNFTGAKKISALIGKQIVSGTITKKWFLIGCQVSSIEHSFPADDYYAKSMEFLVDYMMSVDLAPSS